MTKINTRVNFFNPKYTAIETLLNSCKQMNLVSLNYKCYIFYSNDGEVHVAICANLNLLFSLKCIVFAHMT